MQKILLAFFLLIITGTKNAFSQRIDDTALVRNVTGDKYFRLHYDNDFFAESDYYYTQGYQFELVNPFLKKNPLSAILIKLKVSHIKYGLAFEHYGFTPTSIRSNEILINDRPFAGVIMLKSFAISVNPIRKERLTSIISTGMIGPAAFAGKMQTTIHRWSGDKEPLGWQFQIKNDVVINYSLTHEKEILNVPDIISLNTSAQLNVGTLSDKLLAGITLTLGKFDSPFRARENVPNKNFQIYIYSQPMAGIVGYDASLQGGMFNRNSPFTIGNKNLKNFTFQNNFGIVAHVWRLYLEYNQTFITREFNTGRKHRWGGVKIGTNF